MPIELQDNALVTLEEAKAYLGAGDDQDETVKDIINRISDYAEGPMGAERPLIAREFTDLRLPAPRSCSLRPAAWPIDVAEDVSIELDGVAQTVWRTEADGDPTAKDVVVGTNDRGLATHFVRPLGWRCASVGNPFPIRLSYTGGFDPLPGDLKEAAYLTLENVWRAQTKRTADVQSYGSGPVTPGVTFINPSLIPMKARQVFDAYRVPCA